MITALRQAIKSLRANPGRTTLTTLGIIVGVSTVILVLAAGAGFRGLVKAQVDSLGTNTLVIATKVPPTTKNRASATSGTVSAGNVSAPVVISSFKMQDLDEIERLPNVSGVYGLVVGQGTVSYRDVKKSELYIGAGASRFDIDQGTLREGRFYTNEDDIGAAQVVILGSAVADSLFGQDSALGANVRIGDLNFQVIGVYNKRGGFGPGSDDAVFIPLKTAQKKMLGIDFLARAVIEVRDINLADATAADIRDVLRRHHNIDDPAKDDFTVATQADVLGTLNVIFNGITYLLIAIAAISLLVGGVGIMNIMYVAVSERISEIGLKKAVGAKNPDILAEFLLEALLVTLLGGVIGIALGTLLSLLISVVAGALGFAWKFSVPLSGIALGLGVSGTIGLVFGVFPARRASRLDPIEALRHE